MASNYVSYRSPQGLSIFILEALTILHSIGQDNQLTYSDEPSSSCTTETESVCSTTTFVSATVTGGTTRTTTSASSACEEVRGCSLTFSNTATTTTTRADSCPTDNAVAARDELQPRQFIPTPEGCPADAIVFPRDSGNVGKIPDILSGYEGKYVEVKSKYFGFTSFYWVPRLDQETMNNLTKSVCISVHSAPQALTKVAVGR